MTNNSPSWPPSDIELSFETARIIPGRYANAIQKNTISIHALQVSRENRTSSFVLNLKPGGSATLCRGWRYLYFNDGPNINKSEHIHEQLGYRGSWEQKDKWIYVRMGLDKKVCSMVKMYSHLIPNHSRDWYLRCIPIVLKGRIAVSMPILACQTSNVEPVFGEDEPHVSPDILPGLWIVLGAGNGLRIRISARFDSDEETSKVQIEASDKPIHADAWKHAF